MPIKTEQRDQFLKLLFNNDEFINAAATTRDTSVRQLCSVLDSTEASEYVCINPLTGETGTGTSAFRRADANVAKYRSILFESDVIPLEKQITFFDEIALPVSSVLFSGNKSYHHLIVLEDSLSSKKNTMI